MSEAPTIGYLGIEGSYSHTVGEFFAKKMGGAALQGLETIPAITDAVATGEVEYGIVPVKNSRAGLIESHLTSIADSNVFAFDEADLTIDHQLLALPEVEDISEIKTVQSKGVAIDACGPYLDEHLGEANIRRAKDTATAARDVRDGGDPTVAAIASAKAGKIYGLKPINVGSMTDETAPHLTKFLMLRKNPSFHAAATQTALLVDVHDDVPAVLNKLTQPFADQNINLSDVHPIRTRKGTDTDPWKESLRFYLEADGSIRSTEMSRAVGGLDQIDGIKAHLLGSYVANQEVSFKPSLLGRVDPRELVQRLFQPR